MPKQETDPFKVGDLVETYNHAPHQRDYDGWVGTYTRKVARPMSLREDGRGEYVYKFRTTKENRHQSVGYEATFLLKNLRLVQRHESELLFS